MTHSTPLIATVVAALVLAFGLGMLAHRLRVSPLVGYLLAGVLIGPFTPGYVADQNLADQLAELGIILLMFGVGLHFSLNDLLSVRALAIPGAVAQIAIATLLGMALAHALGWSLGAGVVFGLALSVASTVVLLRAMQERRLIETERGRIAVGWLIVEDIAMVLTLVVLPPMAAILKGEGGADLAALALPLALTLGKVVAFVAIMLVVGRRVIPAILHYVAHTGSRELFRLAVLSLALGVAFGAARLFDVSFALGAFFAGMILSESELSQRAANESLPLRDAFAVLFFVSVGMLFNPAIVVADWAPLHCHRADHRDRQVGRGLPARAGVPAFARHCADHFGEPCADRRVLVHPGGPRRRARTAAGARTRPGAGRRDRFDHAQSAAVRDARPHPAEGQAGRARRRHGRRRPARAAAGDAAHRPRRAGRARTGRRPISARRSARPIGRRW